MSDLNIEAAARATLRMCAATGGRVVVFKTAEGFNRFPAVNDGPLSRRISENKANFVGVYSKGCSQAWIEQDMRYVLEGK